MPEENVVENEVIEEVLDSETLDTEEVDLVISLLTKSASRTIYKKEFVNSEDKSVSFLYVPLSVPMELRGRKIEFGTLTIKGYVVTKVTTLGLSLASPGNAHDTFKTEDIVRA